jgi:hypothetical protein
LDLANKSKFALGRFYIFHLCTIANHIFNNSKTKICSSMSYRENELNVLTKGKMRCTVAIILATYVLN